jgi:putative SOS response-associated peptidase YedK
MCCRYTLTKSIKEIEKRFQAEFATEAIGWQPTFNGAPTQALPVITNTEPREIQCFHFGLVPSKSETGSPDKGISLFNARAETLLDKPTFKHLIQSQRCLILTDGYLEFQKKGKLKQPYWIKQSENGDAPLFAMAGIWDWWTGENGEGFGSFSIITITPSPEIAWVHDRMPLVLSEEQENKWLTTPVTDASLLVNAIQSHKIPLFPMAISASANDTKNNHAGILQPQPVQLNLFD